jgi:hypothetical protein
MLDSESFGEAAVGLSVYAVSMGDVAGRSAGNADAYRSSLVLRIVRCDPARSTPSCDGFVLQCDQSVRVEQACAHLFLRRCLQNTLRRTAVDQNPVRTR